MLQKRGHRVTIVTYYKGRDLPELNIVRTRPTPWHATYEVGSSRHKVAFDALLSWTALKTALRLKPDIIHAHLHEGALIGRMVSALTGAPLVFDYQGSLTAEMLDHHFVRPGGKREWFFRALETAHRSDAARDPHFVAAQRAVAARQLAGSGAPRGAAARLRRHRFLPPAHAGRSGRGGCDQRSAGHPARSDGGDLPGFARAVSGHGPHHSRRAPGGGGAAQYAFPGDGLSGYHDITTRGS